MSHYIAEILLPPDVPVEAGVAQVMTGFCEETEEGKVRQADWWDFYKIGGRFSGHKLECRLDPQRLQAFREELAARQVTVHALTCGKPQLAPASQGARVDALWREWFPGQGESCPLFAHSRDQYRSRGYYEDDVCLVRDIHERLTCSRLIVAGPHWKEKDQVEACWMRVTSFWNGVEWQETDFDGSVRAGLEAIQQDAQQYPGRAMFADDWQVVTVDYHN